MPGIVEIRTYSDLEELRHSQDAFYGSDEWRQGPREPVIAKDREHDLGHPAADSLLTARD